MVGDEGRDATRSSGFTIARQRVPTLLIRSMAGGMAEEGGEGQRDGHSLRGRSGGGVRAPRRGRAVAERVWGTPGGVPAGTSFRDDPEGRVLATRHSASPAPAGCTST